MAVNTSAPMAYVPVMRVIVWLQTRRIATLKIAKCLNRHTAHQVSVKKTQELPQNRKQTNKIRKQGLQILVYSFAKDYMFFGHNVSLKTSYCVLKSDLSPP